MSIRFTDHLEEFGRLRTEFWSTPGIIEELKAYEARNDDHEYKILKGLIPKPLVGRVTNDVGPAWQTSDTFFTDFPEHNYPNRVLSSTEHSHIICNVACHDTRLYSSDIDPSSLDKTAAAGMSYMHLLLITEMKAHFLDFWNRDDSVNKVNRAIHDAMERRYTEVARAYQRSNSSTAPQRLALLDAVMEECRISAVNFANTLRTNTSATDVVFGFHSHPHHSVGHLHMHVLLADPQFRTYSTLAHDWKTLSFEAVEHVLGEEEAEPTIPGGWPA
ncbi:hypothetical protein PLEOSDRAFT_154387 [Pleurotus ostreatus PC15]|uniref:HIT domain-containing protein n=1 Tax=Pleurotus ostreatus (strain PC15) TaxID=1137138 RepID=A0A067NW86_PLEO1|nr:hypothetical protein PLEOSDRAFT_154387 [Pleurotus ostreatus PC15]